MNIDFEKVFNTLPAHFNNEYLVSARQSSNAYFLNIFQSPRTGIPDRNPTEIKQDFLENFPDRDFKKIPPPKDIPEGPLEGRSRVYPSGGLL